jgi:hypothetical protein
MGRARKNTVPAQASSIDDAIRAAIIQDAISRMALPTSAAQVANHHDNRPEPEPIVKRQKLDEAGPVQLPASLSIASQQAIEIEDHAPCVLPWPGRSCNHPR